MSILTVADLLLWNRCRRQWVQRCRPEGGERWAAFPEDLISLANLRETARVVAVGCRVFGQDCVDASPPGGVPAAVRVLATVSEEKTAHEWHDRTMGHISRGSCFVNGLLLGGGIACTVDLARYRPRLGGWEFYLLRPGTGPRGVFETEGSILSNVIRECGIPVAALHLLYLDKKTRRPDPDTEESWRLFFRESNITGRAERGWKALEGEQRALQDHLEKGDAIAPDYRCRQGCRLCEPPGGPVSDRYDVLTLHKGRHIGRELQAKGVFDLRQVDPASCRLTERQIIQIEALRSGRPYLDRTRLERFLASLRWPLSFLDFEAYSQSLPPMEGLTPYQHAPVIASLHRQGRPLEDPESHLFVATPGRDERISLFAWLVELAGEEGTIVVFSKPFESAMVRQIADVSGAAGGGDALVQRMVDLLVPFSEFMIYHPDQRGKVSLKRILPIFTDSGYDHVDVQDGMHANLTCMRHADQAVAAGEGIGAIGAEAAEEVTRFLGTRELASMEDVARYCAMDTRAMVELVDALYHLVKGGPEDAAGVG